MNNNFIDAIAQSIQSSAYLKPVDTSKRGAYDVNLNQALFCSYIIAVANHIPYEVFYSVIRHESNFQQLKDYSDGHLDDGSALLIGGKTPDVGIGQINITKPCMTFDHTKVKKDWLYNMQTAADILKYKKLRFEEDKKFPLKNIDYIDTWVPVIWMYNGFTEENNPHKSSGYVRTILSLIPHYILTKFDWVNDTDVVNNKKKITLKNKTKFLLGPNAINKLLELYMYDVDPYYNRREAGYYPKKKDKRSSESYE